MLLQDNVIPSFHVPWAHEPLGKLAGPNLV
jgi:hypothetical protein